jgi:hypothetical protein
MDHKLKAQASHVIFLEGELDAVQKKNSTIRREFEGDLKRSSDEKVAMQEELGQLQAQGMRHAMELNNLKVKLEDAKILKQDLAHKDEVIAKLKDEIRKRNMELDSKDEENILRVYLYLTIDEGTSNKHQLLNDFKIKGTKQTRL